MMKRIIKITESDLTRIVKRVLREQQEEEITLDIENPNTQKEVVVKGKKPTINDPMKVRVYKTSERNKRIDNWDIIKLSLIGIDVFITYKSAGLSREHEAVFNCNTKKVKFGRNVNGFFSEKVTNEMMKLCDEYADMGSDMGDMA